MAHLHSHVVVRAALALALLVLTALIGLWGFDAKPTDAAAGSMEAMSIDTDITGNDADTIGLNNNCVSATAGSSIIVDVTALNIPVTNPIIGWGYTMTYNSVVFTVSASSVVPPPSVISLLAVNSGSSLFVATEPLPDTDGTYESSVADIGTAAAEFGSGVMERITLDISGTAAAGAYNLTITSAGHIDPSNTSWPPNVINNATVVIGGTCTSTVTFGDVDCTASINSVDALKVLRFKASLSVAQNEPCVDIGVALPNGKLQGDVDCSGTVSSVDALKIQRFNAALSVIQNEPCPDIGT